MEFHEMLRKMVIEKASDLFLKVGGPPSLRIDGAIHFLDTEEITPQDTQEIFEIIEDSRRESLPNSLDIDTAYDEWRRRLEDEMTGKVTEKVTEKVTQEVTQKVRRNAIRELCQDLEIELTEERLEQLAAWDADQLGRVLRQIGVSHEWPSS